MTKKTKKQPKKKSTKSTLIKRIAQSQKNWLEAFKKQWTITGACKVIGIDRGTYYLWEKKYPDFVKKMRELEEEQIEYVEGKLYQALNDGNMTAIIFYLKNRSRSRWGAEERRKFDGELKAKLSLTDEQFNELLKSAKKGNLGTGSGQEKTD